MFPTVRSATADDIPAWLALAREVEPLFGPMPDIEQAITRAIGRGTALVTGPQGAITGGMLLSRDDEPHHIHWLAVADAARGRGLGRALVHTAMERWPDGDIDVVTFTANTPGGVAAKHLYERCGLELAGPADPALNRAPRDRYVLRQYHAAERFSRAGRCRVSHFRRSRCLAVLDGPWWMWLTALSAGLTVASQIERSPK